MKINIPQNIITALGLLEEAGFEAYAVGGCVRDSLLGKEPYDWDVCTSAKPEQTMAVFSQFRTVPTGIKHGTVTVIIDEPIEITTFRIDGEYLDNRRPSGVKFTGRLEDDLCRRDFTVNAMAADKSGSVFDFFGGKNDLEKKILRCVGEPEKRFEEDALRIMRALRFSATLGFEIEEKTAKAIAAKKHLLKNIAAERITAEFSKLLLGDYLDFAENFSSVFAEFLPDASSFEVLQNAPKELSVRLALLLKDSAEAEKSLRTLRLPNSVSNAALALINAKETALCAERPAIKRLLNKLGIESTKRLIEFKAAFEKTEKEKLFEIIEEIEKSNECYTLSRLAVNGRDLSAIGIPDKKIGKALHFLLEMVMDGKVENKKENLIEALISNP